MGDVDVYHGELRKGPLPAEEDVPYSVHGLSSRIDENQPANNIDLMSHSFLLCRDEQKLILHATVGS